MLAYILYSGGLDSILAVKLIQEQDIKVVGVHFVSPFFGNPVFCKEVAREQNFKLIIKKVDKKYLNILRKPKYGYGSAVNPCLDCHLYMLKEIKKIAKKNIIVTGEVLGQRPMSQKSKDLRLMEKELKLENKILRPLSAKLLPETVYEKKGIIDREKLLGISGRSRRKQLKLAKKHNLKFLTPAGGCLLADKEFGKKLKDLFEHKKRICEEDLELLKIGRHFRIGENKIIVGRNEKENKEIIKLKQKEDFIFEVEGTGPTTLLQGKKNKEAIKLAAELTLFYSDEENASVKCGKNLEKEIKVEKPERERVEKFRV
jgi:tRNA U34 2-thiouridine synthase MnmA/TrmU